MYCRVVIKRRGPVISPGYYECGPLLLLLENRRKIEPIEIPSCLIPCLLVVFTQQLEILLTTLVLYTVCLTHCDHIFVLLYSITDAFNETKDKVKYLESLHKYFDQLHVGNSLVNICSNTLPGLMASVRQMDAISRYYARSGYLGLLFSKVGSNGHFTVKPG